MTPSLRPRNSRRVRTAPLRPIMVSGDNRTQECRFEPGWLHLKPLLSGVFLCAMLSMSALALAVGALTAVAFLVVYSQDMILVLH